MMMLMGDFSITPLQSAPFWAKYSSVANSDDPEDDLDGNAQPLQKKKVEFFFCYPNTT